MNYIDGYIKLGLELLGPILPFFIIIFISLYVFWSNAKITDKDRNSVFDMFIIAFIVMIFWGRLMFIFSHLDDFIGLPWSIPPYERYSDGIFFFRLLPWKYFNLWNNGVLELQTFPMFVSYVIFLTLYSFFVKRWRWKDIISAILFSSTIAFSIILIISGIFDQYYEVYILGFWLFIIIAIIQTISIIIYSIYKKNDEKSQRIYFIWTVISLFVIIGYLFYFTFTILLAKSDLIHMYVYLGWGVFSIIFYFFDMNRNIEVIQTVIKSKPVITPNTPIRL